MVKISGSEPSSEMTEEKLWLALSAKGPPVTGSDKAEIYACRRAVEFAVECGFSELVLEGDNQALMDALRMRQGRSSWLGHILQDVLLLLDGLWWVQVSFVKRSANNVAHVLARYAKDLVEDIVWIEDSPPLWWRLCTMIIFLLN